MSISLELSRVATKIVSILVKAAYQAINEIIVKFMANLLRLLFGIVRLKIKNLLIRVENYYKNSFELQET